MGQGRNGYPWFLAPCVRTLEVITPFHTAGEQLNNHQRAEVPRQSMSSEKRETDRQRSTVWKRKHTSRNPPRNHTQYDTLAFDKKITKHTEGEKRELEETEQASELDSEVGIVRWGI